MAAITPTFDSWSPRLAGDHHVVTGTVVVPDTDPNEFELTPTSGYVLYCNVECTTDDATNDTWILINTEDDQSTADPGTVAIQAEAADTFRFTAGVILG